MKHSLTLLFPTSSLSSYLPLYQSLKRQQTVICRILAGDYNQIAPGTFFSDNFFLLPIITQSDFLHMVKAICRQNQVNILWPLALNEIKLINRARLVFQRDNIHIVACPQKTVTLCLDKLKLANWFKQKKLLTPKLITTLSEVKPAKKYVIKPRRSHAGEKFRVIKGKNIQFVNRYIIQEYISGQEFTADCLVAKACQLIAFVVRERLLIS